jgi:transposase, IS5 family
MNLHIGVDSQSGLTHSAVVTSANVHDKHALTQLLRGQERRVYGDSAYASQKALIREKSPHARDFTNQRTFAVVKRLWGSRRYVTGAWRKMPNRAFVALALSNIYSGSSIFPLGVGSDALMLIIAELKLTVNDSSRRKPLRVFS